MDDKLHYSHVDLESDIEDDIGAEEKGLLTNWAARPWPNRGNHATLMILGLLGSATALALLLWTLAFDPSSLGPQDMTLAHTKNGTYAGLYNSDFDQHLFLGMPYAQPPVGSLRFRPSQTHSDSWEGVRSAVAYGNRCISFGVSSTASSRWPS